MEFLQDIGQVFPCFLIIVIMLARVEGGSRIGIQLIKGLLKGLVTLRLGPVTLQQP